MSVEINEERCINLCNWENVFKYKHCHTEVNQGHIIGSNKLNIFRELLLRFRLR